MKRMLCTILAIFCICALMAGCTQAAKGVNGPTPSQGTAAGNDMDDTDDTDQKKTSVFRAYVREIFGTGLSVEPLPDTWERKSSDRITFGTKGLSLPENLAVGCTIEITYDGVVMETYPGQITNIEKIEVVEEAKEESFIGTVAEIKDDTLLMQPIDVDLFDGKPVLVYRNGLTVLWDSAQEVQPRVTLTENSVLCITYTGGVTEGDPLKITGTTAIAAVHSNPIRTGCYPEDVRMIFVDGTLYIDSGEWITEARCGVMDGEITSTTDGTPDEEGQSNFGTGYSYQRAGEGCIDVRFEDGFQRFTAAE